MTALSGSRLGVLIRSAPLRSAPLRSAPLLDEYEALANHIVADCKRSACVLLTNVASHETVADRAVDLDRSVAELGREDHRTRDAALSAVVALVNESTADRVPIALID